jgi:hypothetical protein
LTLPPGAESQEPPALELGAVPSPPELVLAQRPEQDVEGPNFRAAASRVAAVRLEGVSLELRFAQAPPAFRDELARPRFPPLKRDLLPVRAYSNALSVSRSAEAQSF